jgi:hypothetical protein
VDIGKEAYRLVEGAGPLDGEMLLGGVTRTFPAAFQVSEELSDAGKRAAAQPIAFEVQTLRVGPLAIIGIPVEPLNALGLALRGLASREGNAGGPSSVWCAGYANGCYGYLPVREEYPRGGYEVASAHRYYGRPGPFVPETAGHVVAEAAGGIETLWARKERHDED